MFRFCIFCFDLVGTGRWCDAIRLICCLFSPQGSFEKQQDILMMRFADYFGRAFSAVTASQFPWVKLFRESTVAKITDVSLEYLVFFFLFFIVNIRKRFSIWSSQDVYVTKLVLQFKDGLSVVTTLDLYEVQSHFSLINSLWRNYFKRFIAANHLLICI